jgi:hypothetical protein
MSGFAVPIYTAYYSGQVAAGGSINVYQTGTTTPVTCYADGALTTPITNPITLDANGQANFYVSGTVSLRIDSYTASGVFIETVDPIYPVGATTGTAVLYQGTNLTLAITNAGNNIIATAPINIALPLSTGFTNSFQCQFNAQGGAITFTCTAPDAIQKGTAGASYVVTTGTSGELWTDGAGNWGINFISIQQPARQCIFKYTSATICTLLPFKGNKVTFPSGATCNIPSAGIATTYNDASINGSAAQTLTASSLYYAYLWLNTTTGSYIIDWSLTGHSTDANTGIEIKTGDATRVLVGMAYVNSSSEFVNSASSAQVRSWSNDVGIFTTAAFSTGRTYGTNSYGEINSEIGNLIVTWAGERVTADFRAFAYGATASDNIDNAIGIDSTSSISGVGSNISIPVSNYAAHLSGVYTTSSLSEQLHYVTLLGNSPNSITLTWTTSTTLSVTTSRAP